MKNNLAELLDVSINIESLRAAWAEQLVFAGDFEWGKRNYVSLDFFTAYYQHLLLDIENVLGEKPKDYIIQLHDGSIPKYTDELYQDKFYLKVIHKDEYRQSCVNIPVYYDKMEPVYFYDDETIYPMVEQTQPGESRITFARPNGINEPDIAPTPDQVGQYSENHPTLMNVQNWHNVRVLDLAPPRVFIQMSYDIHFDEFIQKGINTRIL
tara:strand:+ start:16 stop:645 length:630 start_codon:yes stop_codon:yes gene_type:complete